MTHSTTKKPPHPLQRAGGAFLTPQGEDMSSIPQTADTVEIEHREPVLTAPVPPVECFPWCTYGDGHPGQVDEEDQWCTTVERHLPGSQLLRDPAYPDEEEYVSVYGMGWQNGDRIVHIGQSENAGMSLTPDEARAVAAALTSTAAAITDPSARSVLDEDLGLAVASGLTPSGYVTLDGDWPAPGDAWEFTADEARALGLALIAHAVRAEVTR